jgi:hypothetical protein
MVIHSVENTMPNVNLKASYEPIKAKRCSTIYKGDGVRPRYVEVYSDNSWAAYDVSYICVPERTGSSADDFAYAYPHAVKKPAKYEPVGTCEPKYLVDTLNANIDNAKLTDEQFRDFVRTTLPIYTVKN